MATNMIIPFEVVDYLSQARDRVTFAFKESPVFDKFLQLMTGPAMDLQTVYKQLMQERSIDTAVGAQLDVIGRIVGQERVLIEADLIPYFGYQGAPLALGYGDLSNSSVGGYYWDYTKPSAGNILLNDEQYRIFIKAKILKNTTRSTPEDIISFIKFVFGASYVDITYDQGAHALIQVSNDLDQFERVLLTYWAQNRTFKSFFVPKTIGVKYDFGTFEPKNFFSFAGVPGGKGYRNLINVGPVYDGSFVYDGSITYSSEGTGFALEPGVGGIYSSIIQG